MKKINQYRLLDTYDYFCKKHTISNSTKHSHTYYEIEFVLKGSGSHKINSAEYKFSRGTMYFLRLTDFHEIKPEQKAEILTFQISHSALPDDILNKITAIQGDLVVHLPESDIAFMEALGKKANECSLADDKTKKELLYHIFMTVIHMFFSRFVLVADASPSEFYDERISSITAYINSHFREEITLELLASRFYLNKNYLCTYFKKHMVVSVLDYIKKLRLDYAVKLIKNYTLKNAELAQRCGYGSESNFVKDFKKHYGCTPFQMRKERV